MKHALIEKVVRNFPVEIDVIVLIEDNRFAGFYVGELIPFVVSQYCNAVYSWSSSVGSIMDRGREKLYPSHITLLMM